MHGTPEAIPLCNGNPLFLRSHPAHDKVHAGVAWKCFDYDDWSSMHNLTYSMQYTMSRPMAWRRPPTDVNLGTIKWNIFLEGSQLQDVRDSIARQLGVNKAWVWDCDIPIFNKIDLLLAAAVEHWEAVVLRDEK
jgi:hypothetical protein